MFLLISRNLGGCGGDVQTDITLEVEVGMIDLLRQPLVMA
jgi:hypothetical protein